MLGQLQHNPEVIIVMPSFKTQYQLFNHSPGGGHQTNENVKGGLYLEKIALENFI